jgi:CheY-like chemotaxis protein
MSDNSVTAPPADVVLVVEGDVLARLAIAGYLRHCGYAVIEAASADEAMTILGRSDIAVDIVFCAVESGGSTDGFGLAKWVRAARPGLQIILAGTAERAAEKAGDLCEEGPHLKKPYESQQVVDWIKKLRNLKPKE